LEQQPVHKRKAEMVEAVEAEMVEAVEAEMVELATNTRMRGPMMITREWLSKIVLKSKLAKSEACTFVAQHVMIVEVIMIMFNVRVYPEDATAGTA
jgi:hypothetical protein